MEHEPERKEKEQGKQEKREYSASMHSTYFSMAMRIV